MKTERFYIDKVMYPRIMNAADMIFKDMDTDFPEDDSVKSLEFYTPVGAAKEYDLDLVEMALAGIDEADLKALCVYGDGREALLEVRPELRYVDEFLTFLVR